MSVSSDHSSPKSSPRASPSTPQSTFPTHFIPKEHSIPETDETDVLFSPQGKINIHQHSPVNKHSECDMLKLQSCQYHPDSVEDF